MAEPSIIQVSPDQLNLSSEWGEAAVSVARNLGLEKRLPDLPPEHWQLVLAGVADRMRLRGVAPPPGWRSALTRQVGRSDAAGGAEALVLAISAKREEIAAHVAQDLGLGELASLSREDRAAVDRQTSETIEGCSTDSPEPADCSDADRTMRRLLSEHRSLTDLRADENGEHSAEGGEVFAPKNDA